MSTYPEKYWHCYVKLEGNRSYAVENDLSFAQLTGRILTPWLRSSPFTVSGMILSKNSLIEAIKVTQTDQPQQAWADRHDARQRANNFNDMVTDRCMLPVLRGTDYTYELLFAGKNEDTPDTDLALVERICTRISYAARILCDRHRRGKQPFTVADEYDIQDLLHAVLRAYIKYSVQEEPLSKVAGTRSSRADISIQELGVLIEMKFVRSPGDQRTIFDDFSRDLVLYTSWSYLKTLFYVIYKSTDLADPEALEKLSGPKEINGKRFDVRVILS
jgi:hypothetical protein